jgi:hypothetical protein
MKPSFLTLLIAAGAFGASTIYLALQLKDERDRADQVLEQTRALNARIAELEKSRAELDQLRLIAGGADLDTGLPPPGKLDEHSRAAVSDNAEAADNEGNRIAAAGPMAAPERSEAFQKMVRSQIRANNKRLYADAGTRLGLSPEQANALIDLLTEQQFAGMERARQERLGGPGSESRGAAFETERRKNLDQVTELIGADKAELYQEYQKQMPARQEVEMLSRQLEGGDVGALSQDQRDRMVTALAEERERVPAPKFADIGTREEYTKAMVEWQSDYHERANSRARSILDADQLKTYNEYQTFQKEMRAQMEARRAMRGGNDPMTGPPVSVTRP